MVADYAYDPWGSILSATGTFANQQPFRYAGYYWDADVGMYYLSARYYRPDLGRFISKDPAHDPTDNLPSIQGRNAYAYGSNDPVLRADPAGTWSYRVHKYDTYAWARAAGFLKDQADLLSTADNRVDAMWKPRATNKTNTSRHFNTNQYKAGYFVPKQLLKSNYPSDTRNGWGRYYSELATANYKRAGNKVSGSALLALGRGLHSIQDKYAHQDIIVQTDNWVDDEFRPTRWHEWRQTRHRTLGYLRKWLRNRQKKNPNIFVNYTESSLGRSDPWQGNPEERANDGETWKRLWNYEIKFGNNDMGF